MCWALPGFVSVLYMFYCIYFSQQPIKRCHRYFNSAEAQAEAQIFPYVTNVAYGHIANQQRGQDLNLGDWFRSSLI